MNNGQGLFVSLFSGTHLTDKDIAGIQGLNDALKSGSNTAPAWQTHMAGCTSTAKQMAKECLINKQSLEELITSQKQATLSTKALNLGMKALGIAGNMLLNMGISFAMSAVIKGLDYLIHYEEKQREKLEEVKSEYQDLESQLKSVQDELQTTGDRIDELNAKGNLTFVEQEELNKLKISNDELERQQHLLELEKKEANKKQNKQFVKTMTNDVSQYGEKAWIYDYGSAQVTEATYIKEQFGKIEELKDQLFNTSDKKDRERIQKQIDAIEKYFTDKSQQWTEDSKGIEYIKNPTDEDEKAVNQWLDYINDFRDRMAIAMGGEHSKNDALTRILNKDEFSNIKQRLDDLGKTGELTGEKVKELISPTSELYQKLVDLGVISADDTNWFNNLANTFNETAKSAENTVEAVQSSMKALNEQIDKIQSAYQIVVSAIKEYNEAGVYSVDTFQALMELEPQYLNMLLDENGNLTTNTDAINSNTSAYIDNLGAKAALQLIEKTSSYNGVAAQLEFLTGTVNDTTESMWGLVESSMAAIASVSDPQVMEALQGRIDAIHQITESAKDGIGKGDLDKSFSDTSKKLKDLAKSEALTQLKYKFDQIEQSITKVDNALSLLNNTLDLTAENDYETKLYTTSRMLELAQQKSALLRDEFAQLDAQEYSSADTANKIATRMKSVADSIAENNKNIINYGKNITEYYTSALTSVSSLSKTTIDEATNLLDRNIKSLSEGGLTGLQFNLSPTIPKSALDKQKEQNRSMEAEMQSYYDTIAQMQKTALDLEYQEQMESYAEQRAELDNTLNKSKTEIKKASKDIQTETKEFTNAEQTTLNNLHDWIKNNPLEAPTLADSWYDRVTEIEDWAKRVQKALGGISPEPWSDSLGNASPKLSSNKVLNTAAAFNGTPYVWGGTKLTDKGLDCSGYIYQVLKKLGYTGERTTADGFRKIGTKIDKSEMQPGDLLFFDYGHDGEADHIGIYAGNNQMWHSSGNSSNTADNPGKGVHLADITSFYANALMQVNRNPYVKAYAKGTKPFDYNGVAGEDKPEYLIDKKTGKMTRIDSPTLINTDEVDVVSQNDTARAERHKYVKGTIKVPDGLGKSYTYMNWDTITNMDTEQGRLIKSAGKSYDSEGYGKIGERYALAMTSTFGKIGDCVDIYMSNGRVIQGILADEKSQVATAWDSNPANEWGHDNGQSMVEFVTNWKNHDNPMSDGTVVRVENLGSYFDSPQLANDISATADNTSKIASVDFESELRNITENKSFSPNESVYQGDILDYIKENADLGRDITEELVSSFDALQAYQNSKRETFDGYRQQLANAVNTDDFAPLREQITDEIVKYADNVIKVSNDITVQSIKDSFDQAQDIQDTILAYFNKRKSEGANADELKVIQDAYNTQAKIVQEYSDQYVSTMSAYTDYIVSIVEKEMQSFSDRISWKDRDIENLEHRLDKTDDSAEKSRITNDIIALDNDKIAIYEEQKTTAHQKAMDMRNDESFAELFKQFGWDDIEAWFDANGEFSAKFADDIKALGADENTAYLVADMQRLAEGIQACKKGWYEADEAVLNLKDHSEELAEAEADRKLDTYIDGQERLADIIDYQAEKQQRLIDAQDKSYKMTQSLRNAQAEIDKEIRANMELAEWLDDDTRRWLFNEDDYTAETKAIQGIQSEMDRLTAHYREDISNLGEEDWYQEKALTAEYERQIDALNEKLDVAKQTLGVAKKQAEYENRAKERDAQIILGNRVVNVADPEAMHKIASEKAEAEIALSNTEKTNAENQNVRDLQKANDQTEQEAASIQNRIDMINSMTDAEKQVFSDFLEPIEVLTAKLNALKYADPNYLIENDNSDKLANKHAPVNKGASLGYSLTEDHSQLVEYLLQGIRKDIITHKEAKVYLDRNREQHNYKTSTDPHNSGYNQYTGVNQYDENLIKTYDTDKRVLDDNPEYNKITEEIAAGKYRIVEPEEMIINVGDVSELMKMGVSDNIIREHMQSIVGKMPTNIVTSQSTNNTPTVNYDFSGDIILTEAITNGNEFVQSLTNKIGGQYPIIKNRKI